MAEKDAEAAHPFDRVFEAAPGSYLLLDPTFRIIAVNDAYLSATMTRRDDIVGKDLFKVFPDNPADPAADGVRNLRASLERVRERGTTDRMSVQKYDIQRPESEGSGFEERYWSPLNVPVVDSGGSVLCLIHAVEDVTDLVRLKAETERERSMLREELRMQAAKVESEAFLRHEAVEANRQLAQSSKQLAESERRYRFLAEASPLMIWTADPSGRLDYTNERFQAFFGNGHLHPAGWLQLVHPEGRPAVEEQWSEALQGRRTRLELEALMRRHDGMYRVVLIVVEPNKDTTGAVNAWLGTMTDVHDRTVAERQLREVQRLQAVGKLAGGVAHEVNNMMSAVLGFGELVLQELPVDHPQRDDVEQIVRAGARASDVTRQLLAFSRQQILTPVVLDLNLLVDELAGALRRLIGSDRRLDIRKAPVPVRIVADKSQVEQVIINLVSNSRDATTTNGVVRVELEGAPYRSSQAGGGQDATNQHFARLTVRDDGAGIPADILDRVFDPFFTTKPIGQGTGLGMSMVHGIIQQSGGSIAIDSTVGAGTTVTILLPLVDEPVEPAEVRVQPERARGEVVLVVEDEPVVRSLARRALEAAGYTVHQAPNGAAAIEFLSAHTGDVDLVLTDVVMSNMNGRQLSEQLARTHPHLPVLFMTGYPGEDILQRGLIPAGTTYVQKPFTVHALVNAVRAKLDERPGAQPK